MRSGGSSIGETFNAESIGLSSRNALLAEKTKSLSVLMDVFVHISIQVKNTCYYL